MATALSGTTRLGLTIDGEVVRKLHVVLDPVKLAGLQAELDRFA